MQERTEQQVAVRLDLLEGSVQTPDSIKNCGPRMEDFTWCHLQNNLQSFY